MLKKFWKSQSGTVSIEYAIIATVIGVAIITGVTNLGNENSINYDNIQERVGEAVKEKQ